jgi:hypothetical protein
MMEHSPLTWLGETTAVQVWWDASAQWLYVRWRGAYAVEAADTGWAFLLQYLQQHPCPKLLSDAREAATGWAGQETWAGEALFPALGHAGVQYVACVYPSALLARVSLDATLATAPQPFLAAFEDVATACSWLQRQSAAGQTTPERPAS